MTLSKHTTLQLKACRLDLQAFFIEESFSYYRQYVNIDYACRTNFSYCVIFTYIFQQTIPTDTTPEEIAEDYSHVEDIELAAVIPV